VQCLHSWKAFQLRNHSTLYIALINSDNVNLKTQRVLLQRHVISLGTTCSVTQRNELLDRRRKLESKMTAYEQRISVIIKPDDDTTWSTQDEKITDIDPNPGEMSEDLVE